MKESKSEECGKNVKQEKKGNWNEKVLDRLQRYDLFLTITATIFFGAVFLVGGRAAFNVLYPMNSHLPLLIAPIGILLGSAVMIASERVWYAVIDYLEVPRTTKKQVRNGSGGGDSNGSDGNSNRDNIMKCSDDCDCGDECRNRTEGKCCGKRNAKSGSRIIDQAGSSIIARMASEACDLGNEIASVVSRAADKLAQAMFGGSSQGHTVFAFATSRTGGYGRGGYGRNGGYGKSGGFGCSGGYGKSGGYGRR